MCHVIWIIQVMALLGLLSRNKVTSVKAEQSHVGRYCLAIPPERHPILAPTLARHHVANYP